MFWLKLCVTFCLRHSQSHIKVKLLLRTMDVPELNFIVILQEALVLGIIHVVRTEHFRKNQEGRNVSFSETFTYVLNE